MPLYSQEEQARLVALPSAILLTVCMLNEADPMHTLHKVMDQLGFVQEVKQAYPENDLIQGIFADTELPPRVLHLSSLTEKETVLHELHLYIEQVSALLGSDTECQEFRAFLVALVKKLTKDSGKGPFGTEPLALKRQKEYLKSLEQQFSPVEPRALHDVDC